MNNQSFRDFSQTNSNEQAVPFSVNEGMAAIPNRGHNGTGKIGNSTGSRQQISSNGFKSNSSNRVSFRSETKPTGNSSKRKVLSVSQILARVNQKKQRKLEQKKRKKTLKPIIPQKTYILLIKDKP